MTDITNSEKSSIDVKVDEAGKNRFLDIVSKRSFGTAYVTYFVNEYDELAPAEIIIDGVHYDMTDPKQIEAVKEQFEKMEKAVEMVEDQYPDFKSLPEKIDKFVYRYHPRWIDLREEKKIIEEPEVGFKCPLIGTKTVKQWLQFCYLSIGEEVVKLDGLTDNQEISAEEFARARNRDSLRIALEYEIEFYKCFMASYLGDKAIIVENEFDKLIKCERAQDEDSFDKIREKLRGFMRSISIDSVNEAMQTVNPRYWHPELQAFNEVACYIEEYKNKKVKLGFDKKDGFPIILLGGKRYDFRKEVDVKLFYLDFKQKQAKKLIRK